MAGPRRWRDQGAADQVTDHHVHAVAEIGLSDQRVERGGEADPVRGRRRDVGWVVAPGRAPVARVDHGTGAGGGVVAEPAGDRAGRSTTTPTPPRTRTKQPVSGMASTRAAGAARWGWPAGAVSPGGGVCEPRGMGGRWSAGTDAAPSGRFAAGPGGPTGGRAGLAGADGCERRWRRAHPSGGADDAGGAGRGSAAGHSRVPPAGTARAAGAARVRRLRCRGRRSASPGAWASGRVPPGGRRR